MLEKTKNKIQQFNIQKASFLIIILPYLGANIISLSESPFFSVLNLVFTIGIISHRYYYKLDDRAN